MKRREADKEKKKKEKTTVTDVPAREFADPRDELKKKKRVADVM